MSKLFLLSHEEWESIPQEYKVPTDEVGRPDWMWLRSEFVDNYPEYRQVPMADCMMKIGSKFYFGNPIIHEGCGVRPGIKLLEKPRYSIEEDPTKQVLPGEVFHLNDLEWIYLGDKLAVMKNTLTHSRFDSKSTTYVGSDVYNLLASLEDKVLGNDIDLVEDITF